MEQLIPTLSTSLDLMTSVEMLTHFRDLVIVHTATHVQDGQCPLVRSTPSQCRQQTVVGAREDLGATLSLCVCTVYLDKGLVNVVI